MTGPFIVDVFDTSNTDNTTFQATWTRPAGFWFTFIVIGAGGGGGSGSRGDPAVNHSGNLGRAHGGAGGGGGGWVYADVPGALLESATYTITVGRGGAGGAASTTTAQLGNTGASGGGSSVQFVASATGGGGGQTNVNTGIAGSGSGGIIRGNLMGKGGASFDFANNRFSHGNGGAAGAAVVDTTPTFAVSGSAWNPTTGVTLAGGTSPGGTTGFQPGYRGWIVNGGGSGGGASTTGNGGTGGAGGYPGGGGGGGGACWASSSTGAGGKGGDGLVVCITYTGLPVSSVKYGNFAIRQADSTWVSDGPVRVRQANGTWKEFQLNAGTGDPLYVRLADGTWQVVARE